MGTCVWPLLLLLSAAVARADVPREEAALGRTGDSDSGRLRGVWAAAVVRTGAGPGVEIPDMQFEFAGDRMSVVPNDKGGKAAEFVIRLDPSRSPKTIDFVPTQPGEATTLGIYAFEGDQIRLCVSSTGQKRPAAFGDGKDGNAIVFVLKRAKR